LPLSDLGKAVLYGGIGVGGALGIYTAAKYFFPPSACNDPSTACGQLTQQFQVAINTCMSTYLTQYNAATVQYGATGIPSAVLTDLNDLFDNCTTLLNNYGKSIAQLPTSNPLGQIASAFSKEIPLAVEVVLGSAALAFLYKTGLFSSVYKSAGTAMSSLYNTVLRLRVSDGTITSDGAQTFQTNVTDTAASAAEYTETNLESYVADGFLNSVEETSAQDAEASLIDSDAATTIDALSSILSLKTQALRAYYPGWR
jgi:hypothetical protein